MTSVLSNYLGNAVLARYFGLKTYLALHLEDPTVEGLSTTEMTGGDYERELCTWSAPGSKTIGLTKKIKFSNLPASTVTWLAVYDAITEGHMLAAKSLVTPIDIVESAKLVVHIGDVAITL